MKSAACAAFLAIAATCAAQPPIEPGTLLGKMDRIIIPAVEFREANAMDVLNFLFEATMAADPDPRHSFGLIHPREVETPRTIHVFKTEDGTSPDIPPFSFNARRLSMLQTFDLICEHAGLRFTLGQSGPELFLSDGRRLLRKEIPAPPAPPLPDPSEHDEWGFGGFDGPIPVQTNALDWRPLLNLTHSDETTLEAWESALAHMGFTFTHHTGGFNTLIDESGTLSSRLQPLDYIQGERQDEAVRWIVRAYITPEGTFRGMAIFPMDQRGQALTFDNSCLIFRQVFQNPRFLPWRERRIRSRRDTTAPSLCPSRHPMSLPIMPLSVVQSQIRASRASQLPFIFCQSIDESSP